MIDYTCSEFGDFSFSRFGFIVRTDRITESHTEADDRYTHATTVDVSNDTSGVRCGPIQSFTGCVTVVSSIPIVVPYRLALKMTFSFFFFPGTVGAK